MSEKIMIERCVSLFNKITECDTLAETKQLVNKLIETYGEEAKVEFDAGYNSINETIYYCSPETDTEYNKRIAKEERLKENEALRKEQDKDKRLEQYLALKAEFEGEESNE